MNAERVVQTGIEGDKTARLKDWLDGRGIKAVLFDLDDTLLDTSVVHEEQKERFTDYIVQNAPDIDRERLLRIVDEADGAAFQSHSVSIHRYIAMTDLIASRFPDKDPQLFYEGGGFLLGTYSRVPKFFPGAKETIRMFRAAIPKLGLVTHSNKEWTKLKVKTHGLDKLVDHIEVIDENGPKDAAGWARAIAALGVYPDEVLVIGDSVPGDVLAPRQAGVEHIINLKSPWAEYREGVIPDGVMQVNSIRDVIPAILSELPRSQHPQRPRGGGVRPDPPR